MSKITLSGNPSGTGTFTIASPSGNTDRTLTLPDAAGTVALQGGAGVGKVLQVVQSTTTTPVVSTALSFTSTGLTGSITPTSASSRILAFVTTTYSMSTQGSFLVFTLFRGTTSGTNLGSNIGTINVPGLALVYKNADIEQLNFQLLDSPNTTSAQTYTLAFAQGSPGQTIVTQVEGSIGILTLMEIAA